MSKKKRAARPRSLRREAERDVQKLADARRRLIALEAGGSPERPLEVESVAVIERRAESVRCPDCGEALRVADHAAREHRGALLRAVTLHCRQCGAPLTLYFRIVTASPN
ncbi:MAG TPA: hypothetical protein VFZ61_05605 [Polyangiales bacterium]